MYIGWNTGELAMDYQCLLQYAVFNFLIECFYCIFVVMKDAFHTLVCLCSQQVTLQLKCCMMHLIPLAKGKHVQWGASFHFNWRLRATAVLSYVVVFAFADLFLCTEYFLSPIVCYLPFHCDCMAPVHRGCLPTGDWWWYLEMSLMTAKVINTNYYVSCRILYLMTLCNGPAIVK